MFSLVFGFLYLHTCVGGIHIEPIQPVQAIIPLHRDIQKIVDHPISNAINGLIYLIVGHC